MNVEREIELLKKQRAALAGRVRTLEKMEDVRQSPLWKRVWFFLCGWRWNRLGRWYRKDLYQPQFGEANGD